MKVTDPAGHRWAVRRQWAPRLEGRGFRARFRKRRNARRQRGNEGRWYDWIDVPFDIPDSLTAALVIIGIVIVVVLLVLVGVPLLLAAVDLIVVVVLLVGGVLARVVFRRPWTVEAMSDEGRIECRQAVGWRASGELKRGWAVEISRSGMRADRHGPAAVSD